MKLTMTNVALAHDYLTQRGGAERVALSLLRAFPGAALHTSLYEPGATFPEFGRHDVIASALNRVVSCAVTTGSRSRCLRQHSARCISMPRS